jgi:hypothetical protein
MFGQVSRLRTATGIVFAVSLALIAALARAAIRSGDMPSPPVFLGAGVILSIGPLKRPRGATSDVVPLPVIIANHGPVAIRIRYRGFSLTDGVDQRSLALLPSELLFEKTSRRLLREETLSSGESRSGDLYFHLPATFVPPIGLRVDLESPDGVALGQTIVSL